jgi:tetratricopeptide (TPR) repeat protein
VFHSAGAQVNFPDSSEKTRSADAADPYQRELGREAPTAGPEDVHLGMFPGPSSEFVGREGELRMLDEIWEHREKKLVTLVGFGGVGKTELVNQWLGRLRGQGYGGAKLVYAWPFHSQGTSEDRQASSEPFFADALEWFGVKDYSEKPPPKKGMLLAKAIREKRTLLFLDGLEPLQDRLGQIRDPGILALLRELARWNDGLCIVTTRFSTQKDLPKSKYVDECDLHTLSGEDGARLLRNRGVKGTEMELKKASLEFGGHALALTLLGSWLKEEHGGKITKRDLIPPLEEVPGEKGGNARRIMKFYEDHLKDKIELDLLHILGLFDRPAEGGALSVLRQEPAICGLTEALCKSNRDEWDKARHHLERLRLLQPPKSESDDSLDCHALVREHFGSALREHSPAAWKEAHGRLYEYFKSIPKPLPDTFLEMEPLYRAVSHGCQAGRHQEAWREVYQPRIRRGDTAFSVTKLGALEADLGALGCFFHKRWDIPGSALNGVDMAHLLSYSGFRLQAKGRSGEGEILMLAALEDWEELKGWDYGAEIAGHLSRLYLTMGDLKKALDYARKSVNYADKSGIKKWQIFKRATLGDALHHTGDDFEAERVFSEAEKLQIEFKPEHPILHAFRGFEYHELLLDQGKYQEVKRRYGKIQDWKDRSERSIRSRAVEVLSFGRAILLETVREGTGDYEKAKGYLNEAIEALRGEGYYDQYVVRALLVRAGLLRLTNEFSEAWIDLAEAKEISDRAGMKLFVADYHLESARLLLAQGNAESAREHLSRAKQMVKEMGYGRRKREVEELEKSLEKSTEL